VTDPIGLALENFDGAGSFRVKENGTPIDTSGTLDGQEFADVVGLGQLLHDHPALTPCLTSRWYAYAVGRTMDSADRPWLNHLHKRFAVHGFRARDLLREIATSRAFYAVSTPRPNPGLAAPSTTTAANLH
jgi:hypothetical protein